MIGGYVISLRFVRLHLTWIAGLWVAAEAFCAVGRMQGLGIVLKGIALKVHFGWFLLLTC